MPKKEFIRIGNERIRISTIKRYKPLSDTKIIIKFTTNPNIGGETFDADSNYDRDVIIAILDVNFCENNK